MDCQGDESPRADDARSGGRLCRSYSAAVAAGKFVSCGGINEPTDAYIVRSLKVMDMDNPGFAALWIELRGADAATECGGFQGLVLTGSVTNDDLGAETAESPHSKGIATVARCLYG